MTHEGGVIVKVNSIALLCVAVLFIACKVGVSDDFARSAATVIDPSVNGFERMTAMSDARNQVKTTKDEAIYEKLKSYDQLSKQLSAANAEAREDYLVIAGGETTCDEMERGLISQDSPDDPEPEWTWNRCQKAKHATEVIKSLQPQVEQITADIQKDLGTASTN